MKTAHYIYIILVYKFIRKVEFGGVTGNAIILWGAGISTDYSCILSV